MTTSLLSMTVCDFRVEFFVLAGDPMRDGVVGISAARVAWKCWTRTSVACPDRSPAATAISLRSEANDSDDSAP